MNFKGLKSKLTRFKQIFTDHWSAFVIKHREHKNVGGISKKVDPS